MFSKIYADYYERNKQYSPYLKTDAFLSPLPGSVKLNKTENKMIEFIEKEQLLDTELWSLFTQQFASGNADSENLGWRGEYWGKMMRGACVVYQYTENGKLYDTLEQTVKNLLNTQDSMGRFSTYAVESEYNGWDLWCRKYIILGLLHFHEICKSESLKADIICALRKHLDYIISGIGAENGKIRVGKTSNFWFGANSVSLLEPTVRMYNITKDRKYLQFAEYLITDGPDGEDNNIFEIAYENALPPYKWNIRKAYELMSCFEGALEYYRVTGNEKYKISAINFAKAVINTDVTIIGCCGCEHELFDNSARTQTDGTKTRVMQETCVTVTWIKLCYQILRLTGDPQFADEIEKSVYNALYGAVNTEKSQNNCGFPFDSYSPLILNKRGRAVGGRQDLPDGRIIYGCCAAIGAVGIGLVPFLCMQQTQNGVAVTMFADGEYNMKTPLDNNLKIKIKSGWPADGSVEITVLCDSDEEFDLQIRIPVFSENTRLSVDGKAFSAKSGEYCHIKQKWSAVNKITINIDMNPHVIHPEGSETNPDSKNYIAVKYGPLILARDSRISADAGKKVDLLYGPDDRIELLRADNRSNIDTLCNFSVLTCDGFTEMIDYQAAGKTWDEASLTEAWLHI